MLHVVKPIALGFVRVAKTLPCTLLITRWLITQVPTQKQPRAPFTSKDPSTGKSILEKITFLRFRKRILNKILLVPVVVTKPELPSQQ